MLSPFQDEAAEVAGSAATSGAPNPAAAAHLLAAEAVTLGLLLAVSLVNVELGAWRPQLASKQIEAQRP